jgi:aminotransferase
MGADMISVFGSLVNDDEIERVRACMDSQWMGFGKSVEDFENEYSARIGLPHFAMVDSGSNALFMAVTLLDLPPGSEVIVPSFTWVSCAQAVLMAGCTPIFCDVDLITMNVRREDIEPLISSRTGAVMVVHYAGLSVDMDEILDLGFPVIEDAAHAVVSTYKGRPCGSLGEVGIFSFDAVKNLTTGEGGGISTRTAEAIERAKVMRYCGIGKSGFQAAQQDAGARSRWWEYTIQEPFIKMLPTNIAASIGLAQLSKLSQLQDRREAVWHAYDSAFADFDQIVTPVASSSADVHSRFTYCIRVPQRDELAHYLLDAGIYTTLRYHPLHMNSLYRQQHRRLPNCEVLNETALSLPLHPRLSDSDVEKVISEVTDFFES